MRLFNRYQLMLRFDLVKGVAVVTALSLGLSGCSSMNKSAENPGSFQGTPACSKNIFLQKYGCSSTQIEEAARSGDPDAQYALGYLYFYGIGVPKDAQTGQMWISKAAAQGQPLAVKAQRILKQNKANSAPEPVGSGGNYRDSGSRVTKLNSTQPTQPLSSVLPGYGKQSAATPARAAQEQRSPATMSTAPAGDSGGTTAMPAASPNTPAVPAPPSSSSTTANANTNSDTAGTLVNPNVPTPPSSAESLSGGSGY